MLFRFTQKLSKKLKLGSLNQYDQDPGPFLEWYAHLFTAGRVQYIITTEAKSLLSIVMYGRGITDDNRFIIQWLNSTKDYLSDIGNDFVFKNFIAKNAGEFIYSKTQNKSILGSMNDMVSMSKYMIPLKDMSPWEISEVLNKTPFKAIDYDSPITAFRNMKRLKLG